MNHTAESFQAALDLRGVIRQRKPVVRRWPDPRRWYGKAPDGSESRRVHQEQWKSKRRHGWREAL